jgi:hypothetical protein
MTRQTERKKAARLTAGPTHYSRKHDCAVSSISHGGVSFDRAVVGETVEAHSLHFHAFEGEIETNVGTLRGGRQAISIQSHRAKDGRREKNTVTLYLTPEQLDSLRAQLS